jgi:hypothetical protein
MASIRASRGNFAEKHHASSNTCSPPAFRISVFENQFSHGLLEPYSSEVYYPKLLRPRMARGLFSITCIQMSLHVDIENL